MSRPVSDVTSELRALGCEPTGDLVKALAQNLLTHEPVADARFGEGRGVSPSSLNERDAFWLLALTPDSAVQVFVTPVFGNRRFGDPTVGNVYWSDVARVDLELERVIFGFGTFDGRSITIVGYGTSGGAYANFKRGSIDPERFQQFADSLQKRVSALKANVPGASFVAELEKLAA